MNKTLRMEAKDILLSHAEKDWFNAIEAVAAKVVLNSNERAKLDDEMAKLKKRPWNHARSSNWIGREPGNREETFGEQRRLLAAERGKLILLKQGVVDMDLQYYDGVRQTIGNLDSLVVEILAKAATLVIAILVAPFSLVHLTGGASGSPIPMRVFWGKLGCNTRNGLCHFRCLSVFRSFEARCILGLNWTKTFSKSHRDGGSQPLWIETRLLQAGWDASYTLALPLRCISLRLLRQSFTCGWPEVQHAPA